MRVGKGLVTIVDGEDLHWLEDYRYVTDPNRYVVGTISRGRTFRLHRAILGLGPGRYPETDHINRNPLDNRRDNLRAATRAENCANRRKRKGSSSIYKGVLWNKGHHGAGKWIVRVSDRHVGVFEDELEAARAYDVAARERFGEFAVLNFPSEPDTLPSREAPHPSSMKDGVTCQQRQSAQPQA